MSGGVLVPGSTIGILGGGQLGRMTALAAANLGYRCHIFAPEAESPAALVSADWTRAAYDDHAALRALASKIDVATYEFENVPVACVAFLEQLAPVRPSTEPLRVAQHRAREKAFFEGIDVAVAPYAVAGNEAELIAAAKHVGLPAIAKTATEGYDGKGQARLEAGTDLPAVWAALGGRELIVEGVVDFIAEASVIVARGMDGVARCFPIGRNVHRGGILHTTTVPGGFDDKLLRQAEVIGRRAADAFGLVGVLCVELFIGRDGRVLANEMAPRPHNSGHWTQDGCVTSQFEQLVRAICGLPLGPVGLRARQVVMTNLIGDEAADWLRIAGAPDAKLHLYGKRQARPGRKMGHVNRLVT
ncbi:5-(carboxyamino)imidazole ribonucleotide synthase [Vineibacter terrae]|uniref:N5-carboxyaminoimidazole ribonucleotide synthase n=1 Tax=Vineibacter terrae TaxID=2586908 RepID=A0A5C8PB86_9HYPH|nr:5-(carboxyamino)imidazole ribonucleotide synthase [Vineibacter terrae]TXL71057.1 5-(carboxyamino)imidazole ribonucleotide synthase [Vineibacter terrae]